MRKRDGRIGYIGLAMCMLNGGCTSSSVRKVEVCDNGNFIKSRGRPKIGYRERREESGFAFARSCCTNQKLMDLCDL